MDWQIESQASKTDRLRFCRICPPKWHADEHTYLCTRAGARGRAEKGNRGARGLMEAHVRPPVVFGLRFSGFSFERPERRTPHCCDKPYHIITPVVPPDVDRADIVQKHNFYGNDITHLLWNFRADGRQALTPFPTHFFWRPCRSNIARFADMLPHVEYLHHNFKHTVRSIGA